MDSAEGKYWPWNATSGANVGEMFAVYSRNFVDKCFADKYHGPLLIRLNGTNPSKGSRSVLCWTRTPSLLPSLCYEK